MRRHRWRTPPDDGSVLIDPALPDMEAALRDSREQLDRSDLSICNEPLCRLRADARVQIGDSASSLYIPQVRQPLISPKAPWILTGHQPELFHPGVWLKNFAANVIARRTGGVAVNVVVDTDTVKNDSIRAPVWSDDPRLVRTDYVRFDRFAGAVPIELWRDPDEPQFDQALVQVQALAASWPYQPVFETFWRHAQMFRAHSPSGKHVGLRFAFARRQLEAAWGSENVDVLQSDLCRTRAFAFFLACVLQNAYRFHEIYNGCLDDYRRTHGLKSDHHPAPDLQSDNDWIELPFWIRKNGESTRSRLFARPHFSVFQLRCGQTGVAIEAPRDPGALAEVLAAGEWHIRTRALTTTLFARLFLADLFIHGIGGAKYDEATDQIIEQFFGMQPPAYAVVTGTLRLPLPSFPANRAHHDQLWRWLRDLDWSPEKFIDAPDPATQQWIQAKRHERDALPATAEERKARFRTLQELTRSFRPLVADKRARVEQFLRDCDLELAANAILESREYAFVLHPEAKLRPFLTQLH